MQSTKTSWCELFKERIKINISDYPDLPIVKSKEFSDFIHNTFFDNLWKNMENNDANGCF